MNASLKWTLFLLGAVCVLLLAGGYPVTGAPAVYKSGLMLLLGIVAAALCLWGGWRLAQGARLRLLSGVACVFFAAAGVAAVWECGVIGSRYAAEEGAGAWFAAAAMWCVALVGLLFMVIFGMLAVKFMSRRLWLAALHLCGVLTLAGAYVDFSAEQMQHVRLSADRPYRQDDFTLSLQDFQVQRYEQECTYTLLAHQQGGWVPVGEPVRQGDELVLGESRWPVKDLRRAPGMQQRLMMLPGSPPQLLLENLPPVRDYRCKLILRRPGAEDEELQLRVNEPALCCGWRAYLMNYVPQAGGVEVELVLRRAPGRVFALLGMLGIIICTAAWCFSPDKEGRRAEA